MQPTTGGFVGIISCWVFGEGRGGGGTGEPGEEASVQDKQPTQSQHTCCII